MVAAAGATREESASELESLQNLREICNQIPFDCIAADTLNRSRAARCGARPPARGASRRASTNEGTDV